MASQFAKVAADLDSHPRVRRAGRNGREVFLFVLRLNSARDFNGSIPAIHLESWYLAEQLMMSEEEAKDGLSRAVTAGLLLRAEVGFLVAGWDDEWSKRPLTTAERQERFRHKNKTSNGVAGEVTGSNDSIVTGNASNASEKSREEEIRQDERTPKPPSGVPARSARKPKPSEPTEPETAAIATVLGKLSAKNGITYAGSVEHTRLILGRLRDGVAEHDLRKIIAYCADELGWKDDPKMLPFLRPETLFGPKTIAKYLDPARTWYSKLPDARNHERQHAVGGAA